QAVEDDGKWHPRDFDRLLDDVALGGRDLDRRLPLRLVDGPAEDDALAAVLVVRLENESLAAFRDVLRELGADPSGPRDVAPDRGPLGGRVEAFVPVVGQKGEAHLLVQELRAEAVDDARGSGHVGLAQRLRAFASLEQLAREHTTVDEVDRGALREQLARPELERARVADDGLDASVLEENLEHLEL